jgi:regulator of sigma E protease
MTILNILYVCFAVMVLFGAAIFFHELGHFWVARSLGMKVEEFAIGMGPKIFSRVRDGIVYSVRWIPAGGFVRLPQMITSEALEGKADPAVPPAPPFHKILVAFAGPFMNLVLAFVLGTIIYFAGLPLLVNPSVIGVVDADSPEGKMGIQEGDRVVAVNGHPVTSWQDVAYETITAPTNVLAVVIERTNAITRASQRATYQLTAKASPLGFKWLNLDPREHPVVGAVESGMPAAAAGFQPGDKVLSVNDIPVPSKDHMVEVISGSEGKACEVVLNRKGQKITVNVTPRYDPINKRARIGVVFSEGVYEVKRPGPTPWANISDVTDKTVRLFTALIHTKQTGVKVSDLSGPVGILSLLAVQVSADYRLALNFLVFLNVNLAMLNLLPIPVLDGGHILMAIIEKIRRRPISLRVIEYTTTGFMVLLISFFLFVTYSDIKRLPLIKAMFNTKPQIEESHVPASAPAPVERP